MTVREVLELLNYGTDWKLVGAKSGRKLCDNYNKKKTQEKYMDMTVSVSPIMADFCVRKDTVIKCKTDYIMPCISIFVSGQ